jgi:hypothetical protein
MECDAVRQNRKMLRLGGASCEPCRCILHGYWGVLSIQTS